jgi:TonB family protein
VSAAAALALVLAGAVQPAATPVIGGAPAVRARHPPFVSYFSDDDYPAAALRGEEEGSVRFRLDIGPQGRATACTVTASSGSSPLDSAVCRILRSRLRAIPARDAQGRAVADSVEGRIRFVLPSTAERGGIPAAERPAVPRAAMATYISARDYPPAALRAGAEGLAYVRLIVGVDGRVRACEITQTSGSATLDHATCRLLAARARYTPAWDGGGPVCDVETGTILWLLPPGRRPPRRRPAAAPPALPAPIDVTILGCPGV